MGAQEGIYNMECLCVMECIGCGISDFIKLGSVPGVGMEFKIIV